MDDQTLIEKILEQQKFILDLDQHYQESTKQLQQDIQDLHDEICNISNENAEIAKMLKNSHLNAKESAFDSTKISTSNN